MTQPGNIMSGFDDNPFADPFAEPSIQQATQGSSQNGLDEYDPFSGKPTPNQTTTTPGGNTGNPPTYVQPAAGVGVGGQPAVVTPTPANPPAYTATAQQQVTAAEFQRRQEELERKAEELARKEEELRNAGSAGARQDNWPPLPTACPIGPCFYQDINVDIPLEFQKIVRMLYYLWMFHALMLLLNILGSLGLFIALSEGTTFFLAIVYFLICTPSSYVCWFRPIYKAFRSDSSFNFIVFFFVFFFQMIFSIFSAIGIQMGSCGWVSVNVVFTNGYIGLGVFLGLLATAETILAATMGYTLIWVHRVYRSTGASFAKAQVEFSQGVIRNEHVQNVAANAASAAVQNQFGGPTTPGGNTASPRF